LLVSVGLPAAAQEAQQASPARETPDAPDAPEATPVAEVAPSVISQFTTGIADREPIDQITFVGNDVSKIYFFSDLRGLAGKTVIHRWSYRGHNVAEVAFEVRGPRWRVWSSKELTPNLIGDWTVEIVLPNDEVFAAETFTYSAAQN